MDTGSNTKWILIAAAVLIVSVPAGLWVTRSSILKSGSDTATTESPSGTHPGDSSSLHTNAGPAKPEAKSGDLGKSGSSSPTVAGGGSSQANSKAGDTSSSGAASSTTSTADASKNKIGTEPPATSTGTTATTGGTGAPSAQVGQIPAGSTAAHTTAPGAQTAQVAAVPKEPEGCVTFAYRHKKSSGHTSDDACSHHKNLIRLKHVVVNPSTVCVRVNKRPVAFQTVKGHADQILIGAVAGPSTDITVRYCLGKTKCSEDCAVPKDEFLSAIGGSEIEGGGKIAQWDPADVEKEADVNGNLDKDIKNELERLDEARPDSRMAAVFQDWIAGQEAAACGTASSSRQAMK